MFAAFHIFVLRSLLSLSLSLDVMKSLFEVSIIRSLSSLELIFFFAASSLSFSIAFRHRHSALYTFIDVMKNLIIVKTRRTESKKKVHHSLFSFLTVVVRIRGFFSGRKAFRYLTNTGHYGEAVDNQRENLIINTRAILWIDWGEGEERWKSFWNENNSNGNVCEISSIFT